MSFITSPALSAKVMLKVLFSLREDPTFPQILTGLCDPNMVTPFTHCCKSAVVAPVPLLSKEALIPNLLIIQITNWPGPLTKGRQASGQEIQKVWLLEMQASLKMSKLTLGFQISLMKLAQHESVSSDLVCVSA